MARAREKLKKEEGRSRGFWTSSFCSRKNFAEGFYKICTKGGVKACGGVCVLLVLWNLFVKLIRRRASNWYIVISRLFKQQVVAVIGKKLRVHAYRYNCFWSIIKAGEIAPPLPLLPLPFPIKFAWRGTNERTRLAQIFEPLQSR